MLPPRGLIFVVSGPSGAGKSTVLARVIGALGDLFFSVSATTREPRPGETDGREYFFLNREKFESMIANDELLEYAQVHSHFYGTPAAFVQDHVLAGRDVVLDLDVQGARKIRKRFPHAIFIFLATPSMDELARRLHGRRTETEDRINQRLERARIELSAIREYDYLVVNEHVGAAALRLQSIVEAERARVDRALQQWPQLLAATAETAPTVALSEEASTSTDAMVGS